MLENDPPPGTEVRFVRSLLEKRANVNDIGVLVKSRAVYYPERPTDEFEVNLRGRVIVVQRQDIVKVQRETSP
jgi:hypothetical protein